MKRDLVGKIRCLNRDVYLDLGELIIGDLKVGVGVTVKRS